MENIETTSNQQPIQVGQVHGSGVSTAAASAAEVLNDEPVVEVTTTNTEKLTDTDLALMEVEEKKKKRKRTIWNVILTLLALFLIQFGINFTLACKVNDPFLLIRTSNTAQEEKYLGFGYTYEMSKDSSVYELEGTRVVTGAQIKLFGLITLPHFSKVEEEDLLTH